MATLRSTRYPGLILGDLGVRFVDGVLETKDAAVIKRAKGLGALGVVVGDSSASAPDPADDSDKGTAQVPNGSSSRQVWADHADSLGVEYPEDAKRDEIKAAVEAAASDDPADESDEDESDGSDD